MNGVIDSVSSVREYEYGQIACSSGQDFPESFSLTDEETGAEIKDQGASGACVACALATVMEALYKQNTGETERFSEGWNYGALRTNKTNRPGMITGSTLDMAMKIGGMPKKYFDILLEMPEIQEAADNMPELLKEADKHKIKGYVKIFLGSRETGGRKDLEIKDALTKYRTPLLAVSPSGFAGGSHAVCITGWDDKAGKYKYKNSWGEKDAGGYIYKEEIKEVYLLLGEKITLPFDDVAEDDWFYKNVRECYLSGLINGREAGKFAPDEPVTRAELAAVVSRLMKKLDERLETMNKLTAIKHEYNKLGVE